MALPDLSRIHVVNPQVTEQLDAGELARAAEVGVGQLSISMCDLGLAMIAEGKAEAGLKRIQEALNTCPSNQVVFHNLVAVLLAQKILRGNNLDSMARFVSGNLGRFPWVSQYVNVLFAPRFLNLEFVAGKCNLKCRMCRGAHSPTYPNELSYLAADDLEKMLIAAPTISGITLSSGDSDPLLHPELERIIEVAASHQVQLDMYTNGHALSARMCRRIVDSQAVGFINFSIDAATEETYRMIRGASFDRIVKKIEMLQAMKAEKSVRQPLLSMSFVAMADNIQELPAFVEWALRVGARRVFVEHLDGWQDSSGGNLVPAENPRYFEYANEAQRLASGTDLQLQMPEQLLHPPPATRAVSIDDASSEPGGAWPSSPQPATSRQEEVGLEAPSAVPDSPTADGQWTCCTWIRGVMVRMDGRLEPCCMVYRVADLGSIHDGPVMQNEKYLRVKNLLLTGKVFERCLKSGQCAYVQQEKAAGRRLELITREELGDLYLDSTRAGDPEPAPDATDEGEAPLEIVSTQSQ